MKYLKILITLLFIINPAFVMANIELGEKLFNAKNYSEALPLLLNEAEKNSATSFGLLARMYGNGWGVEVDHNKAYELALKGAKFNDSNSFYVLGYIYENGLNKEKNINVAKDWYLKSANYDNERAFSKLGDIFSGVGGLKPDPESAEKWIRKSAEIGNPHDQYRLGYIYCCWIYKNKDFKESEKWLKLATLNGVDAASRHLGILYLFGLGNKKPDFLSALPYIEKAYSKDKNNNIDLLNRIYKQIVINSAYEYSNDLRQKAKEFYNDIKYEFPYYWYTYQSMIHSQGIDRTPNSQISLINRLKAFQTLIGDQEKKSSNSTEKTFSELGFLSHSFANFYKTEGSSGDLAYAWNNKFIIQMRKQPDIKYEDGTSLSYNEAIQTLEGDLQTYKSNLTNSEIMSLEKYDFEKIINLSLLFLDERRAKFGPVESRDLLAEGWRYYLGDERLVNEPLAYRLTEEALKLALLQNNKEYIATARNNLGAIASGSINKFVKNDRLAAVHLLDGYDSFYAPNNLLWGDFLKNITISEDQRNELRIRFKKSTLIDHPTISLSKLFPNSSRDIKQIVNIGRNLSNADSGNIYLKLGLCHFLIENFDQFGVNQSSSCFRELLEQINSTIDSNSWKNYDIIDLYRNKENATKYINKLNKIRENKYVADMPDTSNLIGNLYPEATKGLGPEEKQIDTKKFSESKSKIVYSGLNALVIGNGKYESKPLKNSKNDANAIAAKLQNLGFTVDKYTDLNSKQLKKAIFDFQNKSKTSKVTIVYFSGHGVQLGGVNYLVPIDIDLNENHENLISQGISLNDLKNNIPGKTKLFFIDACRNNPFKYSNTKSLLNEGLAPINNIPEGVLISFATKDGGIALDQPIGQFSIKNSPYTASLINKIEIAKDITFILRDVRTDVLKMTNGKQEPWDYSNLNYGELIISKLKNIKY